MNPRRFHDLLAELIDEDPFALRAVLKLVDVEFTEAVPTLCVTCEARPRLRVNLAFVQAECRTDEHVKALLCHELLHVLLRHTEDRVPPTPARHLAADAVINAIIHRELGPAYSSLMARYYSKETGIRALLRPMKASEEKRVSARYASQVDLAWRALYLGQMVVDDLEALASLFASEPGGTGSGEGGSGSGDPATGATVLLGNHEDPAVLPEALANALDEALSRMNGAGVWRAPKSRGVGAAAYAALFPQSNERVTRWEKTTLEVLRRFLTPDARARKNEREPVDYRIPVLSPQDRRAFLGALWQPFLPEARWSSEAPVRRATAQVYLDVSGSMHAEMPAVIKLLSRLSAHVRLPFWAFSDEVAPARIVQGQLLTSTSGGTSLACVLHHLAKTRPRAAVIVTDGYIESLSPSALAPLHAMRLHALVTRDGSPLALQKLGLPYTQLERYPS
jgi:hypothetical protein